MPLTCCCHARFSFLRRTQGIPYKASQGPKFAPLGVYGGRKYALHATVALPECFGPVTCGSGGETPEDGTLPAFFGNMESNLKELAQRITAHYLSRVPATPHYSMIFEDRAQ